MEIIGFAVAVFYATALTWVLYLAVMNLSANRGELTLPAKIVGYPVLWVGLAADALYNFVIGTLFFAEFPKEWLLTERLNRHLKGTDRTYWRYRLARWLCKNFLDPFDPAGRHCG